MYRQANPDKIVVRNLKYRKANPEKVRGWARAAYQKHVAKFSARNAARYKADPAKRRAWTLAWIKAHPEHEVALRQKRRARKAGAVGSYTAAEWKAKKKAFGHRCIDCGMREGDKLPDGKRMKLTVGHAVPLIRGGSNFIGNLIPQCMPCNSRQHAKLHPSVAAFSLFDRQVSA